MCAQAAGINLFSVSSVCSCLRASLCGCTCSRLWCVCVCVHAYFNVCLYTVYIYIYIGEYVHSCMCLYVCLHMGFVQAQRVFNSSECGCVFIQTDAVWWSECQYCSRLPITVCYLSCFSCFSAACFFLIELLMCSTTFVCLCFCVETVRPSAHGNPEENKYQESKFIIKTSVWYIYICIIYMYIYIFHNMSDSTDCSLRWS